MSTTKESRVALKMTLKMYEGGNIEIYDKSIREIKSVTTNGRRRKVRGGGGYFRDKKYKRESTFRKNV